MDKLQCILLFCNTENHVQLQFSLKNSDTTFAGVLLGMNELELFSHFTHDSYVRIEGVLFKVI